jgi:hypothetical protein
MARNNGMALVRADNKLKTTVNNAITPFLNRDMRRQGVDATMFLRLAAQQLEGADFRPDTLGPALLTFAMAGILPNKFLGHGYLIPYRGVVTPVFGYKGLIELGSRARPANGAVLTSKRFDVVLEDDEFDLSLGREQACVQHVFQSDRDPRSMDVYKRCQWAYAVFTYAVNVGGVIHQYHEVELMGKGDLEASRNMSRATKGPWKDWPVRMAQRVPVRRVCASGRIPLGAYPGAALAAEGAAEVGAFADYLRTLQQSAQTDRQAELMEPIIDAGMDAAIDAAEPAEMLPLERYMREAAPHHARLPRASPEDVYAIRNLLKKAWQTIMGDLPFGDELVQKHLDRVG